MNLKQAQETEMKIKMSQQQTMRKHLLKYKKREVMYKAQVETIRTI